MLALSEDEAHRRGRLCATFCFLSLVDWQLLDLNSRNYNHVLANAIGPRTVGTGDLALKSLDMLSK